MNLLKLSFIGVVQLSIGLPLGQDCSAQTVTTVILVRHAEKAATPPADPSLTSAGKKRAQELVRILGKSDVSAVFASEFKRTQQTAQPLAKHLSLTVKNIDAGNVEKLVSTILLSHTGKTVFVVGHSNTVPQIIQKLGAGKVLEIGEEEFDNLYVVMRAGADDAAVLRIKYGDGM